MTVKQKLNNMFTYDPVEELELLKEKNRKEKHKNNLLRIKKNKNMESELIEMKIAKISIIEYLEMHKDFDKNKFLDIVKNNKSKNNKM